MNTFFLLFSYTQPLGIETINLNNPPPPYLTLTREEEMWYELELIEEDKY